MRIIKSLNDSQENIIRDVIELHSPNGFIDLDPCYSKGQFYKNGIVAQPKMKFDLTPQTEDTIQANSDNLPLKDKSINTIMFDPPFVISGKTYKK